MKTIPLNDQWILRELPEDSCPSEKLPENLPDLPGTAVSLPHSFSREGKPWRGRAVYSRMVPGNAAWAAGYLSFDAVDQCCRIWIDGAEAGRHEGGYSRFRIPVPREALQKESFRVDLLVDNRLNEHVSPHFGDFTVFGGIPRPVSLLIGEETRFDRSYFGTDGLILRTAVDRDGTGLIHAEPHIAGCGEQTVLRISVLDPHSQPVAGGDFPCTSSLTLRVADPSLWHGRENPALYTVRAELLREGRPADCVSLTVGFRTVEADGTGFRLNGKPVFLRGVAKHQDRAGSGPAVSPAEISGDFDLIDETGANAVRLSHYQHPQAAYEECDRRGLLAWAEIPMLKMTEDPALQENAVSQLTELILQNIHHPSVFCWGIQNEIAMFRDAPFMHENCRRLHQLIRELDPERLSASANLYPLKPASKLNGITDIVGYNVYFGWYYGEMQDFGPWLDRFHASQPGVSLGITEYGVDANPALHSEAPKLKDYSEEYQALWHETVYPQIEARSWLWGSFIWNMFDFSSDRRNEGGQKGINAKGLVTHDRKTRKDAFYYYKARWSEEPFLHLCAKRFQVRAEESADVKCYTNQPAVRLEVNGIPFGEKPAVNGTALFRNVPLRMGENRISAEAGACTDACVWTRAAEEDPSYRLPEAEGGPVRNWFLEEDSFRREGYFSIEDTANDLLEDPAARKVLEAHVPALVRVMTEQNVIPLGLAMKSILTHDPADTPDLKKINSELNQIPNA